MRCSSELSIVSNHDYLRYSCWTEASIPIHQGLKNINEFDIEPWHRHDNQELGLLLNHVHLRTFRWITNMKSTKIIKNEENIASWETLN